ncbi:MAG: hypothetical protein KKC51_14535, partial [Verrucomicrobia bacterium]|nr:hypothetical protein [Verrucomicrobiota bacterium]
MKRMILLATALAMFVSAASAFAVIDWAGNVWPNHGTNVVPTGPVDLYAQVYKDTVTNPGGQGPDIEAFCLVLSDNGYNQDLAMGYNGDVGNNDEYTVQVPQAALVGATYVDVHVRFHDLTDDTWYDGVNDQAGNPPAQRYNVVDVLPNDIDVTFTLCLDGTVYTGLPCVIGSAAEIGTWGTGVNMAPEGSHADLYTVTVTFLAGGNPSFEYKYKKDDCVTWEGVSNRLVTLPTDGTTAVTLNVDTWDNSPLGCGLGNTLLEDFVLCIQVCLQGVDNTGG